MKFHIACFAVGILFDPRCYSVRGMAMRLGEPCVNHGNFLQALCGGL
jgi:hypothetical protein